MYKKGIHRSFKGMLIMAAVLLVVSCKSKKLATDGSLDSALSTKAIIKNHYANTLDFKTLRGKMKIDYTDGDMSQGFSVSLRMEKDKAIWISATLGIVKAYITPDRVTFYNRLENEYFDGDFTYLSNLLGVELDFEKVQNLLLGNALFDLRKEKYDASISEMNYELAPRNPRDLFQTLFRIEPTNFKMNLQQLSQPLKKRLLEVEYKNYQEVQNRILPNDIEIVATQRSQRSLIDITYKNIEFNKPIKFPYKIPSGFKEIILE